MQFLSFNNCKLEVIWRMRMMAPLVPGSGLSRLSLQFLSFHNCKLDVMLRMRMMAPLVPGSGFSRLLSFNFDNRYFFCVSNSKQRLYSKRNILFFCMWTYAGAEYSLPLCRLLSRLQHMYHEQPYDRVDRNPMLESTLCLCPPSQGLIIWPQLTAVLPESSGRVFK